MKAYRGKEKHSTTPLDLSTTRKLSPSLTACFTPLYPRERTPEPIKREAG